MLGMFAFNVQGISGGLYQMLNHGVSTGALFLLVGMIYENPFKRDFSVWWFGSSRLIFTIFFIIVTLSSIVPMTNGFVGEYLILLGTFGPKRICVFRSLGGSSQQPTCFGWLNVSFWSSRPDC